MQRTISANVLPHEHSPLVFRWGRAIETGAFTTLLILVVLVAIPWRGITLWSTFVFEFVVFVIGAIFALELIFRPLPLLKWISPALPLIALALFAVIQTLSFGDSRVNKGISVDQHSTQLFALRVAAVGLALILLVHYTTTRRRYIALVASVIGAGILASLVVLSSALMQGISVQTYAQFQNKNAFAYLMSMVIGLGLAIVLKAPLTWPLRLLGLILITPTWVALVLTLSRGGLLALTSELLLLAIIWSVLRGKDSRFNTTSSAHRALRSRRARIPAFALFACLIVAIFASVYWIGGSSLMQRLESVPVEFSLDGRTGGNRLAIWRATWRMFEANPVFGTGLGAFGTAITKYHDASGKWIPQQAHNDYLELIGSAGIVGGAIGVWFFFGFLRNARRGLTAKDPFQAAATLGALTGCFGVAVHSLFDYGLHVDTNALVFIALVAITTIAAGSFKAKGSLAGPISS